MTIEHPLIHIDEPSDVDSNGNLRTHELYLPELYWEDHTANECAGGELIKRSGRRVLVRVSDAEIEELKSRANYYASMREWCGSENCSENRIYINSATRTMTAIAKYLQGE